MKETLVGGAFGEDLGVDKHLLALLGVSEEGKPWYSFHWG